MNISIHKMRFRRGKKGARNLEVFEFDDVFVFDLFEDFDLA